MLERLEAAKNVFHVQGIDPSRYAARPRLISTLSGAITDCQEIEVEEEPVDGGPVVRHRLQPHRIVIDPPKVSLSAYPTNAKDGDPPLLLAINMIRKVTQLDVIFTPRPVEPR
jgi:hypothetical protein